MMSELMTDIMAAVQKTLPEQTAGALREHISKMETQVTRIKELEEHAADQLETIRKLNKKVEDLMSLDHDADDIKLAKEDIKKRSDALEREEITMAGQLKDLEIKMLRDQNMTTERLVEKVFGHPGVTVTRSGHNPANGLYETVSTNTTHHKN